MTPLPKRGFGPPLVRYVFRPPQVSVLCFSCKIHDRAEQKLFWRVQKFSGERVLWHVFPPPVRFCTPHVMAQIFWISNSVSITLTVTPRSVFGMNFQSIFGNYIWDQFPGCKGNLSFSSLAPGCAPLWELHLHSGDYTCTLQLFSNIVPKSLHLHFY